MLTMYNKDIESDNYSQPINSFHTKETDNMTYQINGLKDIHKLLCNERKIGGVIEIDSLRLRTGEVFPNAVITNIDLIGSAIYSIGFVTADEQQLIINITELGLLHQPTFKKIHEINNQAYKAKKTKEKLSYLKRLCDLNCGSNHCVFRDEAQMIIEDIGKTAANKVIDPCIIFPQGNVYRLNENRTAG